MRSFTTEGIVLKKREYKDSDKFVTIFTKDYGKISIVARGIRKITSRRAGSLDTLNKVKISFTQNSKDYKNLSEIEVIDSHINIKNSSLKQGNAFYYIELIDKSLEEDDKNTQLYKLLVRSLKLLEKQYIDEQVLRLYFEVNLLKNLGYQIPEKFQGDIIKMLNTGKIKIEMLEDIKKADPIIKTYIHEFVAEKLKSLELV
jgi:DNA repair protein RecO (recombination protein O)